MLFGGASKKPSKYESKPQTERFENPLIKPTTGFEMVGFPMPTRLNKD